MPEMNVIDDRRVRCIHQRPLSGGPVLYWMSRDQRANHNWALLFAQRLALELRQPLLITFCLVPEYLGATSRQYDFMLQGLQQLESDVRAKDIPLVLVAGQPGRTVPTLIRRHRAATLVTDFSLLRINRRWQRDVLARADIPVYEVDAHNIIPAWIVSDKQEYAARTIRAKIHRLLPEFLTPFPKLRKHPYLSRGVRPVNWKKVWSGLHVDTSVAPVDWCLPGERAANKVLRHFLRHRLSRYAIERNDPTQRAQSDLSPYLHFGQLSAQHVALAVEQSTTDATCRASFLEELIVRRELAENFCLYNNDYDRVDGFPAWARRTLQEHIADPRPALYTREEFELARTHDDLWNAAQREMVLTGKMHGYMRMYWAKKILEWSPAPEEALNTAIYLNDKYGLDGRDPNGYAGIAWSIGGLHDRPWSEREIFGKVRYMNFNGCKRKFDVKKYIVTHLNTTRRT